MVKINKAIFFLRRHPRILVAHIFTKVFAFLNDKLYLQCLYRIRQGKKLNLSKPQTFTEKIQWLKLYGRKDIYTQMVDKYEVKKLVANIIGDKYIIPTIGVWNSIDDIDFESLPRQFVLKTTFGGGGYVFVCKDKNTLDINRCKTILQKNYQQDIYKQLREFPYKNVPRRIIAEQYIEMDKECDLVDYKFFCFHGRAEYCQVIKDRGTKETIDFYDCNWNHQEFIGLNPLVEHSITPIPKPKAYEEMIEIANKLSSSIPFLRVDLYNINGKIYFGELTFYPASGFGKLNPPQWNYKLGQMIELSQQ